MHDHNCARNLRRPDFGPILSKRTKELSLKITNNNYYLIFNAFHWVKFQKVDFGTKNDPFL